jgi:hypothetical protein
VSRPRRLPDYTRASELILRGHDGQAMHALMNLTRRVARLLVEALDDPSALHQGSHTVDSTRRTRAYREYMAAKVRRLEALVDLLEGTL